MFYLSVCDLFHNVRHGGKCESLHMRIFASRNQDQRRDRLEFAGGVWGVRRWCGAVWGGGCAVGGVVCVMVGTLLTV